MTDSGPNIRKAVRILSAISRLEAGTLLEEEDTEEEELLDGEILNGDFLTWLPCKFILLQMPLGRIKICQDCSNKNKDGTQIVAGRLH